MAAVITPLHCSEQTPGSPYMSHNIVELVTALPCMQVAQPPRVDAQLPFLIS